jgi:hypothetical protein
MALAAFFCGGGPGGGGGGILRVVAVGAVGGLRAVVLVD